jgi:hypothetical protein
MLSRVRLYADSEVLGLDPESANRGLGSSQAAFSRWRSAKTVPDGDRCGSAAPRSTV